MIAGWQKKLKETEEEISKIEAMSSEYEAQVSSGGKTSSNLSFQHVYCMFILTHRRMSNLK